MRWRLRSVTWRAVPPRMLTSSGQAANFYAVMNIAEAGDHIVCASALYGGTYNLFAHTIRKMGVEADLCGPGLLAGGA